MFFKRHQRDDVFHFAKLTSSNASEVVNFLNDIPIVEHREYSDTPSDRIEYNAFFENWQEITGDEYKREFNRATCSEFRVFINGKSIDLK